MKCPTCDSGNIRADGDLIEGDCLPDQNPHESYFYRWNECDDCGYQWRELPAAEEPALDTKAGLIVAAVCFAILVFASKLLLK